MPVKSCTEGEKPGFKWGDEGKCYPYTAGDDASKGAARKKAIAQGAAMNMSDLKIQMQEIIEKTTPLAVCSVCLYEAFDFVGGADPITLPCPKCNGVMEDPAGFQYVPNTYDALKLHYRPWTEGTKVEGIK